jgi:biopolymer transport protein ExbB/TolQ
LVDPVVMMREGGPFMYPILAVALWSAAIVFERLFFVTFRANIHAQAFMAQIQKLIMANNVDRAIKLCTAEPYGALPRVVKAGLTRANHTEGEIEKAIEEATLEIAPLLNRRTPYLPMLANVATLLGLLGTILGLVIAFNGVASSSAEVKQTLLATGIAVAMYTTAGGLLVAIPTILFHSIIVNRTNKILDDVEHYGARTVNLLAARRRGTLVEEAAAAEG